jgi:DNA-binding LytR/AlgR family response regulator
MTTHARSAGFWRFQGIFWGVAGLALFVSGLTQMPFLQAAVRNLFLFITGFLSSFFLAMLIDQLRGHNALRTRMTAYSIAYVIALFCVIAINAITFTMRGIGLEHISFGQWTSGTMNFALVFAFWAELFIQQVYVIEQGNDDPAPEKLTVESHGALLPVLLEDIGAITASGDYVEIRTVDKVYLGRHTLQSMESRLANTNFLRVHRSTLVNLDWVASVAALGRGRYRLKLVNGVAIDSSRGYQSTVRKHCLAAAG